MELKIHSFSVEITFPLIAVISIVVLSGYAQSYLYCFAAVVLHESGHLIAMLLCKIRPSAIKIGLFDIRIIESHRSHLSTCADIFITAAGPAVNFLLSICFSGFTDFSAVNLFIGTFNSLPVSSLDGGQILYTILTQRFRLEKAALIIDVITLIISIPLFFCGIYVLLISKYNFSLLFLSIYLILSVFLKRDKYT